MDPATRTNELLDRHHPAAARALSDLGRRVYFPVDIPAQSAEARECAINATIGEVTDGAGQPLTLPAIRDHIVGLEAREVFLYAAQGGEPNLRRLWGERLRKHGDEPLTTPLVTCGITHALSLAADLFADPDTEVLLPRPSWGNYRLIFGVRRGAKLRSYPASSWSGIDLDGLASALAQVKGKAVLVLNYPGNPTGYTPTAEEGKALVALLRAHPGPLVVLLDDAYQGMSWEDGLIARSLFYDLTASDPERLLAVKLDGATKELFFFGARIGFLTFGASGPAGEALVDKAKGALRASVSAAPSLSQALVRKALEHPDLEAQRASTLAIVRARYQALREAALSEDLPTYPFNSGFFALVPVSRDADAVRRTLIKEAGVGVVSFNEFGALRLGYGSTRVEDIPALVRAVRSRL